LKQNWPNFIRNLLLGKDMPFGFKVRNIFLAEIWGWHKKESNYLRQIENTISFFGLFIWQHFLINFTKIKIIVSLPNEQRDHLD
jgi:hypothetical protein